MKIVLIEPDRLLADIYRQTLEAAGHEVIPVRGAQAGIMAVDFLQPDIIITELQLVGHSGLEFLYELRSYAEWQTIPVVIQTSVPPSEFNANRDLLTDQLGVTAYLYKPQSTLADLTDQLQLVSV